MSRKKRGPIEYDLDTRTIHLFSELGSAATKAIRLALRELDKTEGVITLEISSDGGNAQEGLSLYETIRSCKNQVNTVAIGEVQSIAFIVYLAGTQRTAQKNVTFMDHSASIELEGSQRVQDLLDRAKELKLIDKKSRQILEERTTKKASWWKRKSLNKDFTFGYEEAVEYGVIKE